VSAARITPAPARAAATTPGDLPLRPLSVGLLHNPLSGRHHRGSRAIRRVEASTPDLRARLVRTATEVETALARFADEGVDLVVVSGGDGTVQAVLTALFTGLAFEAPPLLALMRSGTTNMIARDVGLGGAPAPALRRVLDWARDPERTLPLASRAVLRVQIAPDAAPAFGMFFGAGTIYDGTRYCHGHLYRWGIRGQLAPVVVVARYVLATLGRRPVPTVALTSAVDGEPAEAGDHTIVFVTTLERLVLGLRPFWGVGDGALRLTAVAARPRRLLRALPSLLRGRRNPAVAPEHGYTSRNAREIRLAFDGGCTLDGQLLTADSRRGPVVLSDGGRVRFVRC
jgi:diacylglycerol kinase (ATP)